MPTTALDIGTYSFKAITANPGSKPQIKKVAEAFNPLGFSHPENEVQAEQLSEQISSFLSDHNLPTTDLRLSLPEDLISTKVIEMPLLSDAEIASAIGWQAEQYIPISKEELSLEYKVIFKPKKKSPNSLMKVLMIGARKEAVNNYTNIFLNLGIEPKLLETQTLSILRSLGFTEEDPGTILVHIGASTMYTAIINQGKLEAVFSHSIGGQILTKALEQNLSLDSKQAEEYKRAYGLDETQFQGKVKAALQPSVDNLTMEIQRSIRFFADKYPQDSIKRLVLSGGSSQLPGLVEHISQKLNLEVLLSAPFAIASGEIPPSNHQAMIICMGLLMREL
jgi:type IV pilus assembly protein PilM